MVSSNNRRIFYKLNNYDCSKKNLDAVAEYLRTENTPADFDTRQKLAFTRRYGNGDFALRGDTVVYTPLDLEFVEEGTAEPKLKALYDDPTIGVGAGIHSFYAKVCQKYCGIKRTEVAAFLRSQMPYQLTKRPPMMINRPVKADYPNHRWEADLVDVNYYAGYNRQKKYIITVIDVFSRYVWARPLANKKPSSIIAALNSIGHQCGVFCVIAQVDNGGELKNAEMTAWAAAHDVRIVHSLSHQPTSNGQIERFNGELRKLMREVFVRTNGLNWIDHLQEMCDNRNNTKHGRLKHTPKEMWSATRVPLGNHHAANLAPDAALPKAEIQRRVKESNQAHAKRIIARVKSQEFAVGDKVRISLKAIDNKVRQAIKANRSKMIVVKYTPEVYTVTTIYRSHTHLSKDSYVTTYSAKRFFGSELQRVDDDEQDANVNVDKLNKL